jgi:tetratricopeptide (TPR) repeat protein
MTAASLPTAVSRNQLGFTLYSQGQHEQALACFLEAVHLDPAFAEAHHNLGLVHAARNEWEEATRCFQQALDLRPQYSLARKNLVVAHGKLESLYRGQGKWPKVQEHLEQAHRLDPRPEFRYALATLLPPLYQSVSELETWRQILEGNLRHLHEEGFTADLSREVPTLFYLAYQGLNDRDLNRTAARLFAPALLPNKSGRRHAGGKIKVGFISRFFRKHTIGELMGGLIAQLARERFTVTLFSIGRHADAMAERLRQKADNIVELSDQDLQAARVRLAQEDLDILFFTDVGMEPISYALAFSRFAPVQCATWGHPVTTGIDTIDYFISSDLLEGEEAQDHYTETLVRLKTLPIYYYRPELPSPLPGREHFQLPHGQHLYGCPQSLFKFHPEFDPILAGILRRDPLGLLVLIHGQHLHWDELLLKRFSVTMPDVLERIRFLPSMPQPDYLALLACCDVLLDPLHFGGGNSSYQALAFGVPLVTLPSRFLRGRITHALYRQMGVWDCVVADPEEYVDKAVRLGVDATYRDTVRRKILAANLVLYENREGVLALEDFFQNAVAKVQSSESTSVSEVSMSNSGQLFQTAFAQFQAGNQDQADSLCRQILNQEPENADTLHLLGVIAHHNGKYAVAIERFQQAIAVQSDNAEFHYDLGVACHALGRVEAAASSYKKALELNPAKAEPHNNLGYLHLSRGQVDLALPCFRLALQANPHYAEAHNNLGKVLEAKGEPAHAEESYRQAIRCKADLIEAHKNLGKLLHGQKKSEPAAACFRQVLRLAPSDAETHFNLAWALEASNNLTEAETHFRHALRLQPDQPEFHNRLGNVLVLQHKPFEAMTCYEQALRMRADEAVYHSNLGNALTLVGKPREAEASCRHALRLQPNLADAHHNLAIAVAAQGRLEEALQSNQTCLNLKPDNPRARNVQALWLLQLGRFEQGWEEYEWRFDAWRLPRFAQPAWDGSHLAGRRLLITSEQGLGDAFQFVRYAPLVKQRGGTVIVETWPALLKILASCPGIDTLVARDSPLPDFDVHIPLMSLPRVLKTTLATIPANVPYLFAQPALIDSWRRELSAQRGFKIGISWQGNPRFYGDNMRSIPLLYFAPLATVPGVRLFSLQKGRGSEQVQAVANLFEVVDLTSRLDETTGPFLDTAALMKNLDLVITSDTALAHLAGALGVPVWVALGFSPDWRWLMKRSDCPWYPTMRLFRQTRLGAWEDVFEHMAVELRTLMASMAQRRQEAAPAGAIDLGQTWAQAYECFQGGDRIQAERLARLILDTDRSHGGALNLLGVLLHQSGHNEAALDFFSRAVATQPDNAEFHYNLGVVFQVLDRREDAAGSYRQALRSRPHHAESHNNLGLALMQLGQVEEATSHFRQALRIKPDYGEAHCNLGLAVRQLGELEDAVFHYRQTLRLQPDAPATWYNLGLALAALGKVDEAVAAQEQALRLGPNHGGAHLARSLLSLLQGRFEEGWTEYEWRWKFNQTPMYQGPMPRWDGSAQEGRTVLLYAEQGFGDMLQFVRYAMLVKQRAGKVVLACPQSMIPILSSCEGIDHLFAPGAPLPPFDVQAPLLSLPGIFKTTLDNIPAHVPYLRADPNLVEYWGKQLSHLAGFKIGIAWQGDPKFLWDRWRSIPLRQFAPLASLPGVHLISLQKGPGQEQVEELSCQIPLIEFGDRLDQAGGAFMDTTAIIKNLDLVITSDTAVAHLAGALGVPVWTALSYAPEWRWLLEREDCPWYPTMRLFRQTRLGDWAGVFARLEEEVRQCLKEKPIPGRVATTRARATVCILTYGNYPEYFRRSLDSVLQHTPLEQIELRLGFNDAPASFQYAFQTLGGDSAAVEKTLLPGEIERFTFLSPRGVLVRLWKSPVNLYKEPMARLLYHDVFLDTEYTIWFDDDSFVEEGWWPALCQVLDRKIDYIGQRWWVDYFPGQTEMIQAQAWFRKLAFESRDARLGIHFMTGGFIALRSERIRQANFPDVAFMWRDQQLQQYGGDTLLGEIARQLGWSQAVHDAHVKINVDMQGNHPAPRRGGTGRQFGSEIDAVIV